MLETHVLIAQLLQLVDLFRLQPYILVSLEIAVRFLIGSTPPDIGHLRDADLTD